jgi:hypothetical protein
MKKGLYIILALALTSCFKQDDAVEPYDRGDSVNVTISMGENYAEQLFYDLNSNSIVKQNPRTAWDFCYSSEPGSKIIKLNSGRFMFAARTNETDLSKVNDTTGLTFTWDYINGKEDSLALYQWDLSNEVFVLNMGFDVEGNELGFAKIKFIEDSENSISFEYASLDGSNSGSGKLNKNSDYNYVYHSILEQKNVEIEPKKEDYDLHFGQYVFYFLEEDQEYYVTGVLLNPYKVEASTLHQKAFEEIEHSDLSSLEFISRADLIGYNWKYYDFQASRFEIQESRNYLVKDVEGFYYKLRFTGFYNEDGVKGFPQLEIKKL